MHNRRAMEVENKRARDAARKCYSEDVRSLCMWLKRRDPRVKQHEMDAAAAAAAEKKRIEEAAVKSAAAAAAAAQRAAVRAAMLKESAQRSSQRCREMLM